MANQRGTARTRATLPFDPETKDIVCRLEQDSLNSEAFHPVFNIDQTCIQHSPTGFGWGYSGSGPADFALNILCLFLPLHVHTPECHGDDGTGTFCDHENVACWWGFCSERAWQLHQAFKDEFIAKMPLKGGTITGREIEEWIAKQP